MRHAAPTSLQSVSIRAERRRFPVTKPNAARQPRKSVCCHLHTVSTFGCCRFNDLRAIPEIVCGLVRWLHRASADLHDNRTSSRTNGPKRHSSATASASASSPLTARPANCCRFSASGPALTAVPSFEFALRERAARLANFRHAYYARVRRIDRVQVPGPGLSIVSDHVEGTRLSDILRVAHERNLQLDINAALCLIRQLVPAVALLHENAREVAHGLIAPERLVVTPHARLVIVEHVLAAAVEQLQFSRERLWQEFRIAMPPSAGMPRFDHRADVTGVGIVALALVLGRPLPSGGVPQPSPDAAERGARAHRARRRAAAVAAAARLAGARAAARYAPRLCLGARSADRARGDRRRRFDVRRGAGRARDVPVALHRGAARTACRT